MIGPRAFAAALALVAVLGTTAHADSAPEVGRYVVHTVFSGSKAERSVLWVAAEYRGGVWSYTFVRDGRLPDGTTRRWVSSDARPLKGGRFRVTYRTEPPVPPSVGLVGGLSGNESKRGGASEGVAGIYRFGSGGQLRERLTRSGGGGWSAAVGTGARAELKRDEAKVLSTIRARIQTLTRETYDYLRGEAKSAEERRTLQANLELDLAMDLWLEGPDAQWHSYLTFRDLEGRPYRDAQGRPVPRDALVYVAAEYVPEHAGIFLSNGFVFDCRTWKLLDVTETNDAWPFPAQLESERKR